MVVDGVAYGDRVAVLWLVWVCKDAGAVVLRSRPIAGRDNEVVTAVGVEANC